MGPSLSSALQPGQTFGRYQIVRTIGVGSFGVVYEAVQYPLGRHVALKLLHDRTLTHPDAQARFEREAMAAARMHHPHVVDVFDFGAHEGTAFLAMELLEGESLQALMRRSGPLPQALAVDLMLPIVSAVAAVHDQGVVHRDLKPENFLLTVTPEGQWHPKLLDFGIAKLEQQGPELTRTNALLGTPCYMSPEQVMQARAIDGRADQWSIAVVLYEAVTGAKPFYSDTLLVLMTAITSEDPVPLRVHRPDLDPGFEAVVTRAMQRRPDDRFPSMRDLGSALLPYASPAAQAQWYADFNESPHAGARMASSRTPLPADFGAARPQQPTPMPSFAAPDDEATRARRESVNPVDEPTELVNTTSQDGEFPSGVSQSIRQSVSASQPGAQVPPQDLFAPAEGREVGTGTLAMDLDTAPGRMAPVQDPPRPPTGRMPPYKATVEMESPLVAPIQPATPSYPGASMPPGAPYAPPYGAPGTYPPPMAPESYPGGTFNYTSGEVPRPPPPRGSRKGLVFGLFAAVLGVGVFGLVAWVASQRRPHDAPARPATPPIVAPAARDAQAAVPAATPDVPAAPMASPDVPAAPVAAPDVLAVMPDVSAPAAAVDASVALDASEAPAAVDASAPRDAVERSAHPRSHPHGDAGVRQRPRNPRGPRNPRNNNAPIF